MSACFYLLLEKLQLQQDDKTEAGQALLTTHGGSAGSSGSSAHDGSSTPGGLVIARNSRTEVLALLAANPWVAATGSCATSQAGRREHGLFRLTWRPSHKRKISTEPSPAAAKSNHHHRINLAVAESNFGAAELELAADESSLCAAGHQASVESRGPFFLRFPPMRSTRGGCCPRSSRMVGVWMRSRQ
jgi:hypothetical protein